jgi:hypothetical protein
MVSVFWYPIIRVPDKYSIWTENGYISSIWAIRDDQVEVSPAGIALRKGFQHRDDLDDAIIYLLQAFSVWENYSKELESLLQLVPITACSRGRGFSVNSRLYCP